MFNSTSIAQFSAIVVSVLGAACAGNTVTAAGQYDRDDRGTSDHGGTMAGYTRVFQARSETTQDRVFAYSDHGIAYHPDGDRAPTAVEYIETIRLDTKDPDALHNRGSKDQAKNDLNQIIVYYNAAIRRDPKDDDAYFHRGLANFYAGSLLQALTDLSQASRLDPEYAYYALWIDIVVKRGNAASRLPQAISQINMTKWPAPVIRLFLGQTTPAAVVAAADDADVNTRKGQVCEANFYSGELALQQGAKEEATRLFRLAAADCPHGFVEGPAANAELEALGRSP
jgi:lipoprotein NlpI